MARKPAPKKAQPDTKPRKATTKAKGRPAKEAAPTDPIPDAVARRNAKSKADESALHADPAFCASVDEGKRWELAQRAAVNAAAPFRAELDKLIAEHPDGCPPHSKASERFDALKWAIQDAEARAYAKNGFPIRKSVDTVPELAARLRSVKLGGMFDLQELTNRPRPTDTLWQDAAELCRRDPFLAPLPSKPEDGRQRYAALVRWAESQVEVAALKALGEREVWGVDELPVGVDVDVLRCLDTNGFVEARGCWMQNKQKYPGDPTPPTPGHGQWCSPLNSPQIAGQWAVILLKQARDTWNHPYEVRVSERGRAELARLRRAAAVVVDPPANPLDLSAGAEAIDEHDVALLEFLNRNPNLRRKVSDVLPEKGPQDRKAVAKRLRKLADRTPPLVDYPKDKRSGVVILPAGVEALRRATASTPR